MSFFFFSKEEEEEACGGCGMVDEELMGTAELNIHEHTERGDNESVKNSGKGAAGLAGGCCGGGC